jgi:hypothetical protein
MPGRTSINELIWLPPNSVTDASLKGGFAKARNVQVELYRVKKTHCQAKLLFWQEA